MNETQAVKDARKVLATALREQENNRGKKLDKNLEKMIGKCYLISGYGKTKIYRRVTEKSQISSKYVKCETITITSTAMQVYSGGSYLINSLAATPKREIPSRDYNSIKKNVLDSLNSMSELLINLT